MLNSIVCLGDEDRALLHRHEAESLSMAGIPAAQLSDGTVIDIHNGVAYINSPMLAEFMVLAPRQSTTNPNAYYADLYGYNHRRDAMLPQGQQRFAGDYTEFGYTKIVGPEIYHFGDGIALMLSTATTDSPPSTRDVGTFAIVFSMMSPIEDLQRQEEDRGTVQKFLSYRNAVQGTGSYFAQGDNYYTATTYGVDRTPAYPVYRAALSLVYSGTNPVINQTYNSGNSSVDYQEVEIMMLRISAGRSFTSTALAFTFGYDIMEYYNAGGLISAPFPIFVPLGNNRVVALGRVRNADASLIYGGTFSIAAISFGGTTGVTTTSLSVAGVISGHFTNNAWSCGPATQSSFTVQVDFARSFYLFESMATTQRDCVPISQDETLIFGFREQIDVSDPGGNLRAAWVCFSISPTAVTVKGTVSYHWGIFSDNTYARRTMSYVGATHDNASGVYVFFHVSAATVSSDTFVPQGLFRYYSADNGTTWDTGTEVTLDWGNETQTPPYAYMLSPPKWISTEVATSEVKIIMGYTVAESVTGGIKLTKTTMQTSVDGGITFSMSPVGDPNLNYTLPTGSWLFHRPRGLTSVQEFGNHEDGYAPSPYRHLPTYYGTPTKASRDASNDAGL